MASFGRIIFQDNRRTIEIGGKYLIDRGNNIVSFPESVKFRAALEHGLLAKNNRILHV